jgi:hypothetical protein
MEIENLGLCRAGVDRTRAAYPGAGTTGPAFTLSTALRALRLPCHLQSETAHLALPVEEAAASFDAALRTTQSTRIHLAPLDLADDIPPLAFGSAKGLPADARRVTRLGRSVS